MIRRALLAAAAVAVPVVSLDVLSRRASRRLLAGPRTLPEEAALGPALDALGGEVIRLRSRDGLRLAGRWLAGEGELENEALAWVRDPHEAILLLHGWSGSVAPDLVEYGPFLRRTAGVLGLDFRGHGGSDDGPTTFGLREVEDVAGALAWLGERGVERVALVGTSLGGITALAAVAVLGDGSLAGVDMDPAAPAHVSAPRRPRIVAVVADSVAPELAVAVGSRMPGAGLPEALRRRVAGRLFSSAARTLGADPRDTEPMRIIGLLEGVPLLLVAGEADATVPIADARRLAAAAPSSADYWEVPGADHGGSHRTDPATYEARITGHLRTAFLDGRSLDL